MINLSATKCIYELMVSLLLELVCLGHHEGEAGLQFDASYVLFTDSSLLSLALRKGRNLWLQHHVIMISKASSTAQG